MSMTAPLHLVSGSSFPSRARSSRWIGVVCLSLASVIWGLNFAVGKAALEAIPPMPLLALRMAIAFVALLIVALPLGAHKVDRSELPQLAMLGLIGFPLSCGTLYLGADLLSASMAALIAASTPVFIALCGWFFLKEPIAGRQWFAFGFAMLGMVGMTLAGSSAGAIHPIGTAFLLISCLTWGLYTVFSKGLKSSPLTIQLYALGFGLLGTVPFLRPFPMPLWTPSLVWSLLFLGVIATALAFWLWNQGFQYLDASTGSLFYFFQPVTGVMAAGLFFGDSLGLGQWIGAFVLLGGVLLSMLPKPSSR